MKSPHPQHSSRHGMLTFAEVVAALTAVQERLSRVINPTIYTSAEFAARRGQADSFVNRIFAQPYDVVVGQLL